LLAMASVQSTNRCLTHRYRQQAGSYRGMRTIKETGRLTGRLALAFDFALAFDLPRREAEWRFCAVGTAARMPR
jgi:hypothetical protein